MQFYARACRKDSLGDVFAAKIHDQGKTAPFSYFVAG